MSPVDGSAPRYVWESPGAQSPLVQAVEESSVLYQRNPRPKVAALPLSRFLAGMEPELARATLLGLLDDVVAVPQRLLGPRRCEVVVRVLGAFASRRWGWTRQEATRAASILANGAKWESWSEPVIGILVSILDAAGGCSDPSQVERLVERLAVSPAPAAGRGELLLRLRRHRPRIDGSIDVRLIDDRDTWGLSLRASLLAIAETQGIEELVEHLAGAGATPSPTWLRKLMARIDTAPAAGQLISAMVNGLLAVDPPAEGGGIVPAWPLAGANPLIVRGALSALAIIDPSSAPTLGQVAVHTAAPSPDGRGPRDQLVASAAVNALGLIGDESAVAALVRCEQRISNRRLVSGITKTLGALAEKARVSTDELIECSVPDHGLGADGTAEEQVGDEVVRLAINGDRVELCVASPEGWTTTVPVHVQRVHSRRLAALRAAANAATTTLSSERVRLENLLASDRRWPASTWRTLHLDHPLTGLWARRLLWAIGTGDGTTTARVEGSGLVDIEGGAVEVDLDAPIRLWHPVDSPPGEVQRWRAHLDELGFRQPFKQAWREVYTPTSAEHALGDRSERFADQVLAFGGVYALMKARAWSATALGDWDGGQQGSANRVFRGGTWRATLFYQRADPEPVGRRLPLCCSTNDVRFAKRLGGRWAAQSLVAVPPRVFSETLRDVDLFVSVASIAAGSAGSWPL